jgi:hypothetical protein
VGDIARPAIRQRGEGRRVVAASQLSISLMLAGEGSGNGCAEGSVAMRDTINAAVCGKESASHGKQMVT